jgi:integrase
MSQIDTVATRRQLEWSLSLGTCPRSRFIGHLEFLTGSYLYTALRIALAAGVRHVEIVGPRIEDVQLREDHWVIEAASPQWGE